MKYISPTLYMGGKGALAPFLTTLESHEFLGLEAADRLISLISRTHLNGGQRATNGWHDHRVGERSFLRKELAHLEALQLRERQRLVTESLRNSRRTGDSLACAISTLKHEHDLPVRQEVSRRSEAIVTACTTQRSDCPEAFTVLPLIDLKLKCHNFRLLVNNRGATPIYSIMRGVDL